MAACFTSMPFPTNTRSYTKSFMTGTCRRGQKQRKDGKQNAPASFKSSNNKVLSSKTNN